MWMLFAGLRACTSNSRGALAHLLEDEVGVEEDGVLLDPLAGLRGTARARGRS